ncbi:MAG TPA: amino acid adenylation domain-containing protein [Longimicrobiaceae bacterium]|nr:amino acid adenylation domain-containing protein [Longimicrobiaceae bacterium]
MDPARTGLTDLSEEERLLLARLLEEEGVRVDPGQLPLPVVDTTGDVPLSFGQERLWFLHQLAPDSPAYHIFTGYQLSGPLDLPALVRSFDEILRRHQVLRGRITLRDGRLVQTPAPLPDAALSRIDLSTLPEDRQEVEVGRLALAEMRRPFDLARGPLLHVTLVRRGETRHLLFLTLHHLAGDAWSRGILYRELAELYAAFCQGRPSSLPPLRAQYAHFAVWQRTHLQGETLERALAYWRERLAGPPGPLEIPADRPRPPVPSFRGAKYPLALAPGPTAALLQLSRSAGATLFMTLLSAFQLLLSRYTGEEDVVVGSPLAGRTRAEFEGVIGFFVNTLPLRTDLSGDPTFRELLSRVREGVLEDFAHQEVPLDRLIEELRPERDLSRNPLFQVVFALQNAPGAPPRLHGLEVERLQVETPVARFDLEMHLWEGAAGLGGSLVYSTELFDRATVARIAGHFRVLLEGIAAHPERRLSALDLLMEEERHQVLVEWNRTERSYPADPCVHDLFQAQALRTPDAPAIEFRGEILRYADLDARANRLAHLLRRDGVGPETRVGVCLSRTPQMVAGLLAVLKAGGAYVPLDPDYPRERIGHMLADAQVALVLTEQRWAAWLATSGVRVRCLDAPGDPLASLPDSAPRSGALPENLSHVIFTSGSTGRPKGVMVRHRSTVVLLHWLRETVRDEERSCVLGSTSISFEVSVAYIFGTLCWGGKLLLVENALELAALPPEAGVRYVSMVPTAAAELLRAGGIPASVRTLNLGGEPLPADLAQALYALGTVERVGNLYGPTEDTTYSTYSRVEKGVRQVCIGRPVANTRALVLDPGLRPVPVGVVGELYLSGDGLSRGYASRPELTAERFLPDPFGPAGSRMYRVMDRVRWRPDGVLEYFGRTDTQVKVRGYRIELEEIESVLRRHPAVREAAAVVREDTPGDRRLAAYYVPGTGVDALPAGELREHLRGSLPEYMVPGALVALEALPLTPSGKVDRRALPAPGWESARGEFTGARNAVEGTIAEVWQEVLGVERVGVHDNFFDLGGHSLLLLRVQGRLQEELHRSVSVVELFQYPTIAALAAHLTREDPEDTASERTRRQAAMRRDAREHRRQLRRQLQPPGQP